MKIIDTSIPEVLIIEPKVFSDSRGFFLESFQKERFHEAGICEDFIQINHSGSIQNVLRGIHYQIKHPQGKIVKVVKGAVFDVAVDLRRQSPTFGKYVGEILTEENKRQMWVPPGFGHAFFVLSEWAEFIYMTTNIYAPKWERVINWNDPVLNIDWPIPEGSKVILSAKDQNGVSFKEADVFN